MKRVRLYVDDELEKLGYDQVRSRIRVKLKNGAIIEGRYDVARGHPEKPMTWNELGDEIPRLRHSGVLPKRNVEEVIPLMEKFPHCRAA